MFADFDGVLLLFDVVVPRGDGVGGWSEKVKDALEHGLRDGTDFRRFRQVEPKLSRFSQER